ncbi:HlyD family efflux transporter periplasmic adaptor subunit [Bosea sp. TND4EK4]|uniref:HlyD family efflux transporter periplasmic adaptor subunit n=1 Tax=Bosea sp. TND4EK4 TaxID=1907408 RepID=UPI0009548B26|nr:HlyD family efflux transporter periplasmic adaptor subunit [Bosea sp. TND4EK4]SIR50815.1 HlyD family secretion protein [Bosea sp. TND4EK4]
MKLPPLAAAASVALALAIAAAGVVMLTDSSQADADAQPAGVSPIIAAARGRVDIDGGLSRVLATRDGSVKEVLVTEGQHVEAGEVLARLDADAAEFAAAAAEAALQEAKARQVALEARKAVQTRLLDRMRRAAKEQAVSPQALDEAEAAMATLQGELRSAAAGTSLATARRDAARYEVERRQVRTALAGRVARRSIKPGDVVSAAALTEMFVIIPAAPHVVRAEIQENFVRLVKPGMTADIVSESDERISTAGKVVRIGSFLDARRAGESGTERADVRVAESILQIDNADAFLIGQRVYVRFHSP